MRKLPYLLLCTVALALGAGCSWFKSKPAGGASAKVTFVAPERYTDFRAGGEGGDAGRGVMMGELESFFKDEAARHLPAGSFLDVRVLDINQGGVLRERPAGNVRVADENTPAEIRVEYALTDGSGRVVKSGEDRLLQTTGSLTTPELNQEEMPLLKSAIRTWIRKLAKL